MLLRRVAVAVHRYGVTYPPFGERGRSLGFVISVNIGAGSEVYWIEVKGNRQRARCCEYYPR